MPAAANLTPSTKPLRSSSADDQPPYSAGLDAAVLELLDETAPANRSEKKAYLAGFISGARFGLGDSSGADDQIEAEIRRRAHKPRR